MSVPPAVTAVSDVTRALPEDHPDRARRPGLRAWVTIGLAVLVGLSWGAATSGLQTVLPGPFAGLANAIGPWVAPAFLVGALGRRPWVAALAGVLVCWAEVSGYYATSSLRGFGINLGMVMLWTSAGVVGGSVLGATGWCWRRARAVRWTSLAAALLGGVFLTEGIVLYAVLLGYAGHAVLFCTLGLVLAVVLAATAPAARAGRSAARAAAAAAGWLLLVLPLGAGGLAGLVALMAWLSSSPAVP